MIDYIKKIFEINNYKSEEEYQNINFLSWKWEYFIIWEYTTEELNIFFKSDITKKIVTNFKEIKKKEFDIEKNTSLIILLKVDDLKEDFLKLKNQIMVIEEDEYFFRKYIIIYDEKWESEIKTIKISEIDDEIKNVNLEAFRQNPFWNPKNYLLIQIFIKLPFLKVVWKKISKSNIWSLMNDINENIRKQELVPLNTYILEESNLDNDIEEFENNILDIRNENVDAFLNNLINWVKWK